LVIVTPLLLDNIKQAKIIRDKSYIICNLYIKTSKIIRNQGGNYAKIFTYGRGAAVCSGTCECSSYVDV
jgi:hypothetical protein